MKLMKRIINYWLPPLIWGILIFSFSARTVPTTTEIIWQDFVIKKTAHIIEYGIFSILIYRGLINFGIDKKKAGLLAIFITLIYGFTDEFHQSFVPGRQPRVRDVIFDTIGSGIGIYFVWKLLPKAPPKLRGLAKKLDLN